MFIVSSQISGLVDNALLNEGVHCRAIEGEHTTGPEPGRNVRWNYGTQPCLGEEAIEIELCDNFSRILLHKVLANKASMGFKWGEHPTAQWLSLMGVMQ